MHTVSRTDTARIPVIDGELAAPTTEIPFPWMRPAVTVRYLTPRSRWSHRWHRFTASPFADDVRAGFRRGVTVMGVFGLAYFGLLLARGAWVATELLDLSMTRDQLLFAACLAVAGFSGLALLSLRNPRSLLSRWIDRLDAADTTTREVTR